MKIELQRISTDFKGNYCYTHARAGYRPDGFAIITTQPLRLSGSDIFYGMQMLKSFDGGKTWSDIIPCANLTRLSWGNEPGAEHVFCDATPFYHKTTGKMILTGHNAVYLNDELYPDPRPRNTVWSVYDEKTGDWSAFRAIPMPENSQDQYFSCGSGCGQILELENGELLIPVYYKNKERASDPWHNCSNVTVLRCSFDGEDIRVLEIGNSLTVPVPRGLGEPSIVKHQGKYFLALRNDEDGYVSRSGDGLYYENPVPLCFDDGSSVGNYCTQQHWITGGGKLWLVYTRRGANNDHVFRHRAPLFIAEFDPEGMCVIRDTEQIAVPERGARLGNFGCVHINDQESWVVVSEWMQPIGCEKYGSDNTIFVSKITF
jgi:hypothetical protein